MRAQQFVSFNLTSSETRPLRRFALTMSRPSVRFEDGETPPQQLSRPQKRSRHLQLLAKGFECEISDETAASAESLREVSSRLASLKSLVLDLYWATVGQWY